MYHYSVIIPIYNRPQEIDELLESLTHQTYTDFDVLVIEDGSTEKCDDVVVRYQNKLQIEYFYKENGGQGFARNYGFERAEGDYFVVFDSDCLIPENYFEEVEKYLIQNKLDAYGGPDASHASFTLMQKAISYSMTSLFTTGGIRGKKQHVGRFHPRSFNMGISKMVFEKTRGYIIPFKGEDIEFSIRIIENGFKVGLIPDAKVFHKRRTNLRQFFKQLHFFGTARINISRFYKSELKLVHAFPMFFFLGFLIYLSLAYINMDFFIYASYIVGGYFGLIFIDALIKSKNILVAFLSIFTSFTQLFAYGMGFIQEGLIKIFKA